MEDTQANEGAKTPEPGPGDSQGRVTITIDGTEKSVRRGQQRVSELKELGNVPSDYVLEQLVDGVLTALPDDGMVHIRGGEIFSSHPGSGGAA